MKPKTILVLIALFFALTMQAAGKAWCLVTDKGEVVELSHVNYFLASSEETFDIVCSDGSSIKGVISISVEERNLSGIQKIRNDDGQFSQLVGDNLIVSGLKSATQAQVLSLSGVVYFTQMLNGEKEVISVSRLQPGTYILKVGETSVKFIKK